MLTGIGSSFPAMNKQYINWLTKKKKTFFFLLKCVCQTNVYNSRYLSTLLFCRIKDRRQTAELNSMTHHIREFIYHNFAKNYSTLYWSPTLSNVILMYLICWVFQRLIFCVEKIIIHWCHISTLTYSQLYGLRFPALPCTSLIIDSSLLIVISCVELESVFCALLRFCDFTMSLQIIVCLFIHFLKPFCFFFGWFVVCYCLTVSRSHFGCYWN